MSTIFRLSLLQGLQNSVFACAVISLGTYLLQGLDFSGREVGMIYATNAIAATISPPVVGWLADRKFSADRMLVVLNLLAAVAMVGCFFVSSFLGFYALFLVFNLCFMPTFGLLAAVCFHQLDEPAKTFPRVRVWGTISFMFIGLGLSYFSIESSPIPLIIGAAFAVITAVGCLTLPRVPPQPGFNFTMLGSEEVRKIFREPGMLIMLTGMFLSCIPSSFYYSFLNPFLNEIGWKAAAAKMSLGQLGEIAVVLLMPFAFRKLRFRTIFFWGIFLWGMRYFAFAVARPEYYEWLLYAGILVQGFAFAWIVIAGQIYVDNRVPVALRSTAQGLVSFTNQGLGIFLGSWMAGEVVNANELAGGAHDWFMIWLIPGVIGVLAAFGFLVFFPKAGKL